MPSEACRGDILGCYAKHLTGEERGRVARETGGMSGRDLRDVAEATERRWASKLIRGLVVSGGGGGGGAGAADGENGNRGWGRGGGREQQKPPPPLPPVEEYLISAHHRRRTHI